MESSKIQANTEALGFLIGHNGPVTSIVVGHSNGSDNDTILVSGSRDKTLIIWNLGEKKKEDHFGSPMKCLTGHNHFVTDLDITNDNVHVISSSWDKTMRLWDIRYGKCIRKFIGHQKEIETVCFSNDNCKVFSAGHEKKLALWNVLAQMKSQSNDETVNHREWVTKVRYSASAKNDYYASVGRDGRLKLWNGNLKCIASIKAHDNYINALALSLNGQYIVTGGKDASVKVWDYHDLSKPYVEYKTESEINALAFNKQYQLIAVATDKNVKVWDILNKKGEPLLTIDPQSLNTDSQKTGGEKVRCTSISWSGNSKKLYVGCSDGHIRVYNIIIQG